MREDVKEYVGKIVSVVDDLRQKLRWSYEGEKKTNEELRAANATIEKLRSEMRSLEEWERKLHEELGDTKQKLETYTAECHRLGNETSDQSQEIRRLRQDLDAAQRERNDAWNESYCQRQAYNEATELEREFENLRNEWKQAGKIVEEMLYGDSKRDES